VTISPYVYGADIARLGGSIRREHDLPVSSACRRRDQSPMICPDGRIVYQ
jgi:hypothetical protein